MFLLLLFIVFVLVDSLYVYILIGNMQFARHLFQTFQSYTFFLAPLNIIDACVIQTASN